MFSFVLMATVRYIDPRFCPLDEKSSLIVKFRSSTSADEETNRHVFPPNTIVYVDIVEEPSETQNDSS